jgi:hypothetical protein
MKEISDKMKKNVLNGLVLDEKGHWVSIAEKVEYERSFLMHLEAGEILCDGKWVSIHDLPKKSANSGVVDPLLCAGAVTELEETRDMSNYGVKKNVPKLISDNKYVEKNVPANPFIDYPFLEAEVETKFLKRIDLRKEFTAHQTKKSVCSEDYLDETMSFDMKAILNAAKDPLKLSIKTREINNIADSWDVEKKRNQVLFFSITATIAFVAIVGAVILAFVL